MAAHILVADAEGGYAFRHALLREVVHDDLLPGERTELHSVLARALEKRIEDGDTGAHITAQAAHHWMAAGDQAAALVAAVRAAGAAERVDAYAEAHALLERALGLWRHVDDPEALIATTRVDLLLRAAHAAEESGEGARFEALLRAALDLLDPAREPYRVASVLSHLHSIQWELNRQDESIETIDRALSLLDGCEPSRELAGLLAAKARARMLQARNREAIEAGREALEVARTVDDVAAEAQALNAIGVALAAARRVDEGIAALREGHALARERGLLEYLERSSVNLADTLHNNARSEEALEVAREGLEEARDRKRQHIWLAFLVAEIEFDTGDWRGAAAAMPDQRRRYWGTTLLNYAPAADRAGARARRGGRGARRARRRRSRGGRLDGAAVPRSARSSSSGAGAAGGRRRSARGARSTRRSTGSNSVRRTSPGSLWRRLPASVSRPMRRSARETVATRTPSAPRESARRRWPTACEWRHTTAAPSWKPSSRSPRPSLPGPRVAATPRCGRRRPRPGTASDAPIPRPMPAGARRRRWSRRATERARRGRPMPRSNPRADSGAGGS